MSRAAIELQVAELRASLSATDPETLYERLVAIFDRPDADFDELGLVVSAEPQHLRLDESARSEVEVVRVGSLQLAAIVAVGQHKLALAYWAAAVLFPVALRHFLRLRYALLQLCDEPLAPVSAEVAAHRLRQSNLSDTAHQENARLDEQQVLKQVERASRIMLLVTGDNYSALNARKRLVLRGFVTPRDELKTLNFIFSKHPKSGDGWAHRKWVLRQLMQSLGCASPRDAVIDGHVVRTDVVEIIRGELDECALVGERYSKNYNCWSYRREALKWSLDRATLRRELDSITVWLRRHISEHCAYHYRQFVLLELLRLECSSVCEFVSSMAVDSHLRKTTTPSDNAVEAASSLDVERLVQSWLDEFNWTKALIHTFPGHEAMWCHLRFLALHWALVSHALSRHTAFQQLVAKRKADGASRTAATSTGQDEYKPQQSVSFESELAYAEHCQRDTQVARFEEQAQYARGYGRWLREAVIHQNW